MKFSPVLRLSLGDLLVQLSKKFARAANGNPCPTLDVITARLFFTDADFLDGLSDVNDYTEVIYKLEVFGAHVQEISRDDDLRAFVGCEQTQLVLFPDGSLAQSPVQQLRTPSAHSPVPGIILSPLRATDSGRRSTHTTDTGSATLGHHLMNRG